MPVWRVKPPIAPSRCSARLTESDGRDGVGAIHGESALETRPDVREEVSENEAGRATVRREGLSLRALPIAHARRVEARL